MYIEDDVAFESVSSGNQAFPLKAGAPPRAELLFLRVYVCMYVDRSQKR